MRHLRLLPATIVLLAVAALPACSSDDDSTTTTTTSPATTTSEVDGTLITEPGPVELQVGGSATLELEANPTTGYRWEVASEPDDAVFRVVSDTYVGPDSSAMGAAGTQRIVVEGVAAGTAQLELRYVRPWEEDSPPAETATYTITVA